MDEYDYLQNMNNNELIDIINKMLDFEEVSKALMILEEKDMEKAIELGCEIITENKGVDYLQATTWDFIFQEDNKKMLEALEKRNAEIGKVLLNDIIEELTIKRIEVKNKLVKSLNDKYIFYYKENSKQFRCDYKEFCRMYLE